MSATNPTSPSTTHRERESYNSDSALSPQSEKITRRRFLRRSGASAAGAAVLGLGVGRLAYGSGTNASGTFMVSRRLANGAFDSGAMDISVNPVSASPGDPPHALNVSMTCYGSYTNGSGSYIPERTIAGATLQMPSQNCPNTNGDTSWSADKEITYPKSKTTIVCSGKTDKGGTWSGSGCFDPATGIFTPGVC